MTHTEGLAEAEAILGHTFLDQTLLSLALTHASAAAHHNEPLACLGDRVHNVWAARQVFLSLPGADKGTDHQDDQLRTFDSSARAERGLCGTCGSSLFYRFKGSGQAMIAAGSLDDLDGLVLANELFVDSRPDADCFVGDLPGPLRGSA